MIKRLTRGAIIAIAAVMLLLPFNKANAGIPVGTWRAHPAYNDATSVLKAFGYFFVLSDGALYFYDPADNGMYSIDKTGGLADTDISAMGYCSTEKAVLLAYSNGNIDIIYDDFTIYNYTDLKNNSTGNASVNELKITGNKAYISTNLGLVVFDIKRREISNTYRFKDPVLSSVIKDDSLFCATKSGLYLGLSTQNLLDQSNWEQFLPHAFNRLYLFDGKIWGTNSNNGCWTIDTGTKSVRSVGQPIYGISFQNDDQLALLKDSVVTVYNSVTEFSDLKFSGHVNDILIDGDGCWTAEGINGLCLYVFSDGMPVLKMQGIKPNSPRRNWFHSVSWPQQGKLVVVGGCFNYSGIDYPGTVMIYENDKWSYLEDDLYSKTGVRYINLTEAAQDPYDPDHIFVGSAGQGLYEFRNNKLINRYTWNNSKLQSILNDNEYNKNNYIRISALQFDKDGNLWMANNEIDTIIKVLEPDGNWFGLYYSELKGLPTFKQLKFRNDRIWINSSRYIPGIACIYTNGTLKNSKDDKIKFSGPVFINQDGNSEEISDIYFYEFDLDGVMWIGTNKGIFVLRNPDNYLINATPVFERIKISRDDDSGLADYLFNGVNTTAIYIDQGNRKWIGTLSDGVFLLSADGTQTLEHFTTSNSPLPSDNILSITENGQDGSLFFGTSLGMVEYGGQARDPYETLSESNILVYPNPVKPDFDGYVTVTGLTQWSTIRIMSNSGRLVHQGISNGGSYSWNLNDMNGNPVPSGVYHAIITNQENSKSESVSITVIR